MFALTKKDIVLIVAERMGAREHETETILTEMLDYIKINSDPLLKIANFGTFKTTNKRERKGRNPNTGEEYPIKARKFVSFYPSKRLRNHVSGIKK
jgi:integration host factor subunit alpha